jgi:hypothetical protein
MLFNESDKNFDYVKLISEMPISKRLVFYEAFARNLTIAVRAIYSIEKYTDAEKALGMKWMNEISHRVLAKAVGLRRLKDGQEDNWAEDSFWHTINWAVSHCPEIISEYVEHAIIFSYDWVNDSRS